MSSSVTDFNSCWEVGGTARLSKFDAIIGHDVDRTPIAIIYRITPTLLWKNQLPKILKNSILPIKTWYARTQPKLETWKLLTANEQLPFPFWKTFWTTTISINTDIADLLFSIFRFPYTQNFYKKHKEKLCIYNGKLGKIKKFYYLSLNDCSHNILFARRLYSSRDSSIRTDYQDLKRQKKTGFDQQIIKENWQNKTAIWAEYNKRMSNRMNNSRYLDNHMTPSIRQRDD